MLLPLLRSTSRIESSPAKDPTTAPLPVRPDTVWLIAPSTAPKIKVPVTFKGVLGSRKPPLNCTIPVVVTPANVPKICELTLIPNVPPANSKVPVLFSIVPWMSNKPLPAFSITEPTPKILMLWYNMPAAPV